MICTALRWIYSLIIHLELYSCENKMSPDEADMDLDLHDKLVATEVEKFHSLYEGVEDKTVPVSNIAESQADPA